jgi:release factor glutamine methyltransferase
MKTISEILKLSTDFLNQRGIANARRQAQELISDALDIKPMELYLAFDRPLNETELELCRKRLARRAKGEPNAYIHGQVEFHDCRINVNPSVIIPRQETGILVDKIIQTLQGENLRGKVLWDVCCGSGCIGLALKKHLPDLSVSLSDLSSDALDVARENARQNQIDVTVLQGDLLQPFQGKRADFIVCNPPYISEQEFAILDPEVRDYEPHTALLAGPTGIEFYVRLAQDLPIFLLPGGKGWFEIGAGQGEKIQQLFSPPLWKVARVEKDWAGLDRFFLLEIE